MIKNFYKYARNRYLGDYLNFYMCINVNQDGMSYVLFIETTDE